MSLYDLLVLCGSLDEEGRAALLRILGPTCFDDDSEYAERFWELLETRSTLR